YAWRSSGQPEGIVNNSIVQSRVQTAADNYLSFRGMCPVASNPDVYMVTHITAENMVDYWPIGSYYYSGWNGWGTGWGPEYGAYHYVQGTVIIDMIDARTNKLVWRSITTKDGDDLTDVQKPKAIDKMVYKAFKHFPLVAT